MQKHERRPDGAGRVAMLIQPTLGGVCGLTEKRMQDEGERAEPVPAKA
jgi:hypothetical protein